jgi:hypothetical protein
VQKARQSLKRVLFLAMIAWIPLCAAAQSMRYEKVDFVGLNNSLAGINDHGMIIGSFTAYDLKDVPQPAGVCILLAVGQDCGAVAHAFIYAQGKFTMVKTPNGVPLGLVAINNHDQILLTGGPDKWFIYDIAKKEFRPIGMTGRLPSDASVRPFRIRNLKGLNDKGEILAVAGGGRFVFGTPALGAPGSLTPPTELGEFTLLPNCPGGRAEATGLNAQDQVSGTCYLNKPNADQAWFTGFVYHDGAFQTFSRPLARTTYATAINNNGVVTGYYQLQRANQTLSYVYDGSKFTEVPVTLRHDGHLPDFAQPRGSTITGRLWELFWIAAEVLMASSPRRRRVATRLPLAVRCPDAEFRLERSFAPPDK